MILKEYELIRITNNEELVLREHMTVVERSIFYYKLNNILKRHHLYLNVINRIENEYLYTIESLEDIQI